jgi:hypothetical protein
MVTVFEWDMFKGFGVGHASLLIHGNSGSIYISFWPAAHTLKAGWSSPGLVHFINGDIRADGRPSWASKSISTLDEAAIISWWSKVQHNPFLDYAHKTPIQVSGVAHAISGNTYSILYNQCSTMVVTALLIGADEGCRTQIFAWLAKNMGSLPFGLRLPNATITPLDVKKLVEDIF